MNALDEFSSQLERNRNGQGGVAVSVCSAHPMVLRAAFRSALRYDSLALIESTSNQVDQYGGYTGMRPDDFSALVYTIAAEEGFPKDRVLLGGDHLDSIIIPEIGSIFSRPEIESVKLGSVIGIILPGLG